MTLLLSITSKNAISYKSDALTERILIFQVKSKFLDVFNQITSYLNLRETEYFGLAQKKGKVPYPSSYGKYE